MKDNYASLFFPSTRYDEISFFLLNILDFSHQETCFSLVAIEMIPVSLLETEGKVAKASRV